MKTHLSVFAFTAILVVSIGIAPAFGQVPTIPFAPENIVQAPITVTTDKETYVSKDVIVITGEVSDQFGMPVTIRVLSDNGNVVTVDQLDIGPDRTFSTTVTAGGGLMKATGIYTVEANYGPNRSAIAVFTYEHTDDPDPIPVDNDGQRITDTTVSMEGTDDLIGYEITGGKILSIVPEPKSNSLIVTIEATEDGSLTLTIPRTILDAKMMDSDEDADFFVLLDIEETEFEETRGELDRTVTIEFPAGTETIQIIGTFVIPEFGAIAAMILAVAIISIIAISAKSRLSIMPRY